MSISRIIKAIKDYQEVKETTDSSDKYSFPLQQARQQIESEIIAMIDARIKTHVAREKRKSTTSMEAVTEMSERERDLLDALNSAPVPPANPPKWLMSENPLKWIENYMEWYYGKRLKSIK